MSDIIESVRTFYNETGLYFSKTRRKSYGTAGDHTWIEMKKWISKIEKGDSVLDLGCGNGRLLTGINKDIRYKGIDFSETLINEARKIHPREEFLIRDITKESSWRDIGNYKWIFSVATMHHIPNKEQHQKLISDMKMHLLPRGKIYISVWNLWQSRYIKHHLRSIHLKIRNLRWLSVPFHNKWYRFCFAFDKAYLRKLLQDSGLKIEEIYYPDKQGNECSILEGRNLVAVASKK